MATMSSRSPMRCGIGWKAGVPGGDRERRIGGAAPRRTGRGRRQRRSPPASAGPAPGVGDQHHRRRPDRRAGELRAGPAPSLRPWPASPPPPPAVPAGSAGGRCPARRSSPILQQLTLHGFGRLARPSERRPEDGWPARGCWSCSATPLGAARLPLAKSASRRRCPRRPAGCQAPRRWRARKRSRGHHARGVGAHGRLQYAQRSTSSMSAMVRSMGERGRPSRCARSSAMMLRVFAGVLDHQPADGEAR